MERPMCNRCTGAGLYNLYCKEYGCVAESNDRRLVGEMLDDARKKRIHAARFGKKKRNVRRGDNL